MQTYVLKSNNGQYIAPNKETLSGINLTDNINGAMIFDANDDSPELKEQTYNVLAKMYIDERTKFKAISL